MGMFLLLTLNMLTNVASYHLNPLIIGGTPGEKDGAPYVVMLQNSENRSICGGAILSEWFILTAGHCIRHHNITQFRCGITQLTTKITEKNHGYVDYGISHGRPHGQGRNDIGLIKVKNPIQMRTKVQSIALPVQSEPTPMDKPAMVAGWGRSRSKHIEFYASSTVLLYLYVDLIPLSFCQKRHSNLHIDQTNICSHTANGQHGPSFGDSGGPLVIDGKIFGVVSAGRKPKPDIYMNVAEYVTWIERHMQKALTHG